MQLNIFRKSEVIHSKIIDDVHFRVIIIEDPFFDSEILIEVSKMGETRTHDLFVDSFYFAKVLKAICFSEDIDAFMRKMDLIPSGKTFRKVILGD